MYCNRDANSIVLKTKCRDYTAFVVLKSVLRDIFKRVFVFHKYGLPNKKCDISIEIILYFY